ncbi:MAG: hypothetical protein JNM09_05090 [Blastocatellia bacterium]|nr:hypothetical protein [Blastocatellia bacterium]
MRCPSLDRLTDYLRGFGVGTERATIQEHLNMGCPDCQQNQQWLLAVKRIAPLDDSFEFPAAVTAHILSWMPTKPVRTPLRTLLAQLIFDSFAAPPLAEVRSATMADAQADSFVARQLLYQVDGIDVDLRIEKAADAASFELLGQVLRQDVPQADLAGQVVHLWQDDIPPIAVNLDAEGMFRIASLSPEIYELRVTLPDGVIAIPEITIGEV